MSKKVLSDQDFGNLARIVNHPDPVNPQDVATRAFVVGNTEVLTVAPGVQTLTLLATTRLVFIRLSAPGDAIFTQIVHGSNSNGAILLIVRDSTVGSAGRVILRDGNASVNSLWTPSSVDWILANVNDGTRLQNNGFRWYIHGRRIQAAEVQNAMLADMGEGTVKLRALGSGTGPPIDGTGTQLGAIMRLPGVTVGGGFVANGTYNDYALDGGHYMDVGCSGGGDVIFTGFAIGASNVAAWFYLTKFGGSGRIIIKHENVGSLAANRVSTPAASDYVMEVDRAGVLIAWINTRLQIVDPSLILSNSRLAAMGEGTVKLRALGSGTGPPIDGTGAQLGEFLRMAGQEDSPTAAGTYEPTLAAGTTIYRVNPVGDVDVSFTGFQFAGGNTGKWFLLVKQGLDGWCKVKHNVGVVGGNGVFTPDEQDFVLSAANSCAIVWFQTIAGRWNIAAIGTQITPWNLSRERAPFGITSFVRIAVDFTTLLGCGAGVAGAPDDVELYNACAPVGFVIKDVHFICTTTVAAGTVQLRTAAGGLGASMSSVLAAAVPGTTRNNFASNMPGVPAGSSLYLRRSDAAIAGQLVITCYRY